MKRISILMLAAFAVASTLFVSCNKDTVDPTVKVTLNGQVTSNANATVEVESGDVVVMSVEWEADSDTKLERISFSVVGGTGVNENGFRYPLSSGFSVTDNLHRSGNIEVSAPNPNATTAQTVTYNTEVVDKNNGSRNVQITITFKAPATGGGDEPPPPTGNDDDLREAVNHDFVYVSQGNQGNTITPALPGIIWFTTTATPAARFRAGTATTDRLIVALTAAAYDNIKTKKDLSDAFNAGTKVRDLDVTASNNRHFIFRNGDNLSLVHVSSITFSPHRATLSVKQ